MGYSCSMRTVHCKRRRQLSARLLRRRLNTPRAKLRASKPVVLLLLLLMAARLKMLLRMATLT